MKKLLITLIFIPQLVFAGFNLSPSIGAYKKDNDKGYSQVELRIGYTFDFGLYLGGLYSLASTKIIQEADSYYIAPTVGYNYKNGYVLASYFIAGEQDLASGGIKYGGAKGYQFTFGYALPLGEDVFLGPEMNVRSISYKDEETQGIAAPTTRKDTTVYPSIAFWFKF